MRDRFTSGQEPYDSTAGFTREQQLQYWLRIVKDLREYADILSECMAKIAVLEKKNPSLRVEATNKFTTSFERETKRIVDSVNMLEEETAKLFNKP